MAAGIEGGSWDRILDTWTFARVEAIRRHWKEFGPPVHIGIALVSQGLGNRLTEDPKPKRGDRAAPVDLGTVDLSDVPTPVAGGDTLAASRALLEKLQAIHGG